MAGCDKMTPDRVVGKWSPFGFAPGRDHGLFHRRMDAMHVIVFIQRLQEVRDLFALGVC